METRRRLITSSSFAVGWLHLDGPVHLEREKEREMEGTKGREGRKGKSQVSTKTIGATVTRHSGKRTSEMWR